MKDSQTERWWEIWVTGIVMLVICAGAAFYIAFGMGKITINC